jgi:hypothetical protein
VSRLRRWADDVLWGPETAARLVIVHVGLSALIGLRIVRYPYWELADTPAALFDPVAVLGWLDRMPPAEVIVAVQVVGVLAALAAALRRRPRLAFAIAWVCYLVLAGLRGSRGKVLHNDLLLLWASAPFLLAPAVADLRDLVARRRYGWPIRSATVIVALIYLIAGLQKLWRSGPDWVFGENMRYVMLWGPSIGEPQWQGLTTWVGENLWAAQLSAAFILGVELSFPVILFVRRLKVLYALAAVFLHTMTWLVLGLDYWAWAVTVALLLVDWPAVVARARSNWPARGRGAPMAAPP